MQEPSSSLIADSLIADSRGLICAFQLAPLTRLEREPLLDLELLGSVWLHFNLTDRRARDWLSEQAQLPRAAAEALLSDDPHVHAQTLPEGIVAVLRDLHHEREGDEAGFGTFVAYVDAKRMITGRWHALHTLDQLRRELGKSVDQLSPLALFEHLLECLAESFATMVAKLLDRVEARRGLDPGRSHSRSGRRAAPGALAALSFAPRSAGRSQRPRAALGSPAAVGGPG